MACWRLQAVGRMARAGWRVTCLDGRRPLRVADARACLRCQRDQLGLEEVAGVDAHGREVPGDLEAHEAVQAAPDSEGAQGDGCVNAWAVCSGQGQELGCERLSGRAGGTVPEFAQHAEQDFHRSLRCLDESLRVRVVAGQRRPEQQPVPVWLGQGPGPAGAGDVLEPCARLCARRMAERVGERVR
jgi:hypothetical protein